MPPPKMIDVSSNNIPPGKTSAIFDLAAYFHAGNHWIGIKATESTTYRWADGLVLADRFHKLGGHVVWYPFLHPETAGAEVHQEVAANRRSHMAHAHPVPPEPQADFYLSHIGSHWKDGDRPAADCEITGVGHDVVKRFIDRVHATHPVAGLTYGGSYFLKDANIRPVHGWELWLAGYPTYPFTPAGWDTVTAHQFTDHATGVPGVPGSVDQSYLYGSMARVPKPKPNPGDTRPLPASVRLAAKHLTAHLSHRKHRLDKNGAALLDGVARQIKRVEGIK